MATEPKKETAKPEAEAKPMTTDDFKKLAEDYAVPISDGTIEKIVGKGEPNPEKEKAFIDYLKTTAIGLYPTLATQIKAGIPTSYLLDPYRQVAKQMLGEDHEPNFATDPKASAALSGGSDPETGRPAPMSLDGWKQHIMSHPGFEWGKTPAAHEMVDNVLQSLGKDFGHQAQQPEGMPTQPTPQGAM